MKSIDGGALDGDSAQLTSEGRISTEERIFDPSRPHWTVETLVDNASKDLLVINPVFSKRDEILALKAGWEEREEGRGLRSAVIRYRYHQSLRGSEEEESMAEAEEEMEGEGEEGTEAEEEDGGERISFKFTETARFGASSKMTQGGGRVEEEEEEEEDDGEKYLEPQPDQCKDEDKENDSGEGEEEEEEEHEEEEDPIAEIVRKYLNFPYVTFKHIRFHFVSVLRLGPSLRGFTIAVCI